MSRSRWPSRQGVVEAKRPANGEGPVGDVVNFAGGPFFLAVVDEEGADLEGGGLVGFGVGGCVGLDVGHFAVWAEGDGVNLRDGGGEWMRGEKCGWRE